MYSLEIYICNHYLLFVRHSVLYIRFGEINILYLMISAKKRGRNIFTQSFLTYCSGRLLIFTKCLNMHKIYIAPLELPLKHAWLMESICFKYTYLFRSYTVMITFYFQKSVDNIAILSSVNGWMSLGIMIMRTYRLHWTRITHKGYRNESNAYAA